MARFQLDAAVLLTACLLGLTTAGLVNNGQRSHTGIVENVSPQLAAFAPQVRSDVNSGQDGAELRPVRQTVPNFGQPLANFDEPSSSAPGLRRKRQISEELRQMLNAPYAGPIPSSLDPLMRGSTRRNRNPGQFLGINPSAEDVLRGPDSFVSAQQRPQRVSQTFQPQQQSFQPQQQVFQPEQPQNFESQRIQTQPPRQQSFQPQQQSFQPQSQPQSFQPRPQRQSFQPQQQSFQSQPQSFQPQPQSFQAQPQSFRRQAGSTNQPQQDGFVPDNAGFPSNFFSQLRGTIFGGSGSRNGQRQKRQTGAGNGDIGFFEMPPGFPSMNTLGGFSDNFDAANSEVIDVAQIQFPETQFESRQDEAEPLDLQEQLPIIQQRADRRS